MRARGADRLAEDRPISVYEVHLESWLRGPNGESLTLSGAGRESLVEYVKQMGYTHIELLPMMEHPFSGSWGYQVIGYFAPTSRFGTPDDFKYFVERCHQAGIGVIVDWVPAHFPKDAHGLVYLRRHGALRARRSAQGRASRMGHADLQLRPQRSAHFSDLERAVLAEGVSHRRPARGCGRLDAVPGLLAQARRVGSEPVRRQREPGGDRVHPPVQRAGAHRSRRLHDGRGIHRVSRRLEAGLPERAGLHHEVEHGVDARHAALLRARIPIHRKYHHNHITFSLLYAFTENFVLPISHDEVVHGKGSLLNKMPGDEWRQFANVRAFLAYMWAHPGKKLLFMGQEIGQREEWNHDGGMRWELLEFDLTASCRLWCAN